MESKYDCDFCKHDNGSDKEFGERCERCCSIVIAKAMIEPEYLNTMEKPPLWEPKDDLDYT